MVLATPADREFRVNRAGFVRDSVVMATFREGLRKQKNPETGQTFTEEEIARATRPGSRWYNEAQAIDDYGQGEQRNALFLADQVRVDRATGRWLLDFHGRPWNVSHLAATGGSGEVEVKGTPGTIVLGSTTLPDSGAYQARDPAGNLYQVFGSEVCDANGNATVTMAGISTGTATNLEHGTKLTWVTRDPNMQATATVDANDDFTGGTDRETDQELAERIDQIMHFRPGAGNDSQFRAWAREASNAIRDGFIYPCALHAGSVIAAIIQKRGKAVGPLGRMPSAATLATAIGYLVPPNSPVVPTRPFVITTPWVSDPSDVVIRIGMQRASQGGWTDAQPFPAYHATTPNVTNVTDQTHFTIQCAGDGSLPGQAGFATLTGSNAPKIMLWNKDVSAWVELPIQSITDLGDGLNPGTLFAVVLTAPLSFTVQSGMWVSPATPRAKIIAKAMEQYFDELGPGDFFDVDADARGARCQRFPSYVEEWPFRAGATIATRVLEALGGVSADGALDSISKTEPGFQASLQLGPKMLTLGKAAIYEI